MKSVERQSRPSPERPSRQSPVLKRSVIQKTALKSNLLLAKQKKFPNDEKVLVEVSLRNLFVLFMNVFLETEKDENFDEPTQGTHQ